MLIWAGLAAVALVGMALLAVGLRGRRVDDHPICRRCGFDLIGLYCDGRLALGACPECGSELSPARAIRLGNRRRGTWQVTVGALVVTAAGLLTTTLGIATARGFDWNTIKPVWWLCADLRGGEQRASCGELKGRFDRGELSAGEVGAVVDACLDAQADRASPWTDTTALLLQTLYENGRLTTAQIERGNRTALTPEVVARRRVVQG